MRKITVAGSQYEWMRGRENVKIVCKETKFSKIIPSDKIGKFKWRCSECCESSEIREDVCSFATCAWVVTPKDIEQAILLLA